MSITLSTADLEKLARAVQVLTTPLDFPSPDAWRSAVLRVTRELVDADTCGFHLPLPGRVDFYSDDYSAAELASYPDVAPPPLADGTDVVGQAVALGVHTLEGAYGDEVGTYYRSDYYNEYAVLLGKRQTLFAAFAWDEPGEASVACLQFFRERPAHRPFGAREAALLRLLLPAYRAGAETCVRWAGRAGDLLGVLEGMESAALICDARGGVLHRTSRLEALLRAEPDGARLEAYMVASASVFGQNLLEPRSPELLLQDAAREVRTGAASYRIRSCRYGELTGGPGMIVTSLERR